MTSGAADGADYPLGYRSQVEGLRAVAILLVVAAHAGMPGLAGGFVGVDVFFVLSGYLITGLLTRERESRGRIDLAAFYARRVKRLLPAWILVLVVTCILAALLVEPARQPDQAAAASAAALWMSNFHFALFAFDYFDPAVETNLFLHTWSLGVEEQFYLLWPLLIIAAMRSAAPARHRLRTVLLTVTLLSLGVEIASSWLAPQMAFYLMPARAWEFALGGLVFLHGEDTSKSSRNRIAWLGLLAVALAATLLDGNERYPGFWALLPAFGTAAALTATPGGTAHRALSWTPLQWIGRRSYSWYLWHWPVLLLPAGFMNLSSGVIRFALAAASLALAALSYRWVELPLRQNPRLASRPRFTLATGLWLVMIATLGTWMWRTHAENEAEWAHQQAALRGDASLRDSSTGCGDEWFGKGGGLLCEFGSADAQQTVLLVGDSVAAQWTPALRELFAHDNVRLIVNSHFSCPMTDEPFFNRRVSRDYAACAAWREGVTRTLANLKPDLLVISSTDTYPFSAQQWTAGLRRVLQAMTPYSRRVVILRATPTLPDEVDACGRQQTRLSAALADPARCRAPAAQLLNEAVFAAQRAAAADFPNVSVIDVTDLVCQAGSCEARRDGVQVYRDRNHLATAYARSLAPALLDRLGPLSTAKQVP